MNAEENTTAVTTSEEAQAAIEQWGQERYEDGLFAGSRKTLEAVLAALCPMCYIASSSTATWLPEENGEHQHRQLKMVEGRGSPCTCPEPIREMIGT